LNDSSSVKDLIMLQDPTKELTDEQSSMSSSAETPSIDESSVQSPTQPWFQYTPLEPSDCSIRLVVLERLKLSYQYNPEIRCRMLHTTFGAKPKYQALSYMWGTEMAKQPIKIDGHHFEVSSNLFDSLLHLGNSELERTLWIDAICINQKDIDERNSQIKLMPFIYKRAETVVVWLGGHLDRHFVPRESQYWQRLWVIQEIAKARRLNVSWAATENYRTDTYYTLQSYDWKDFFYHFAGDHVYKFNRLRDERYGDESLLRNLLLDHQSAQCKDPRDKIYGLVGLSIDCSGRLAMDYRKSLWEVYKDVISVYHGYPGILELSRLLKRLIGGPEKILARDLAGDEAPEDSLELDAEEPTTVKMPSCFLGTIVHVGPSYNDVISFPQKANDWDAAVEQEVNNRKPEKREQSDLFLEALEDTNEEALKAGLSISRKTSWRRPEQDDEGKRVLKALKSKTRPEPTDSDNCLAVSLFLVHDEQGLSPRNAMGICCEGAAVGDFVFQIPNYGLAMVIRRLRLVSSWKLIGYAGIAVTAELLKQSRELPQQSKLQFDVPGSERITEFNLYLNMSTLYRMSN